MDSRKHKVSFVIERAEGLSLWQMGVAVLQGTIATANRDRRRRIYGHKPSCCDSKGVVRMSRCEDEVAVEENRYVSSAKCGAIARFVKRLKVESPPNLLRGYH